MSRSLAPSVLLALSLGATASLAHGQEVNAAPSEDAYVPAQQTLTKSARSDTYLRLGAAFGVEATNIEAGEGFKNSTTGSRMLLDVMGAIPVSRQFELGAGAYFSRSEGKIKSGSREGIDYSGDYSLSESGLALAPTVKLNESRFGAILRMPVSSSGQIELDISAASFGLAAALDLDLSVEGPELGLFYRYAVADQVALGVELDGLLQQRHKMKGEGVKDDGTYARRSLAFSSQFMF